MKRLQLTVWLWCGLLTACSQEPPPPGGEGLCWLRGPDGAFSQIDHDVANVETCAARLEASWLKARQPVTGAYGGHFVYLDEAGIQFGLNGTRVRLIDSAARESMDRLISEGERPNINQP